MKKKSEKSIPPIIKDKENLIFKTYIGRYSYTALLEVFVYKDKKSMQQGAMNDPKWGLSGATSPDFAACFSKGKNPHQKIAFFGSNGHWYDVFGAIFLNLEDITYATIAHECIHAALAYNYYYVKNVGMMFGGPNEEHMVSAADEYFENILKTLNAHKIPIKECVFGEGERNMIEINNSEEKK